MLFTFVKCLDLTWFELIIFYSYLLIHRVTCWYEIEIEVEKLEIENGMNFVQK